VCHKKCVTGETSMNTVRERSKNTIFSFFGAPGSGKGTIAEECVKVFNFKVLSTGNLCRAEIATGTDRGLLLKKYLDSGRLVPDELIAEMVEAWLTKETVQGDPIILDGYPRTQKQAEILLSLLKKFSQYKFRVISLAIPDEEIIKRLSDRLMCGNKKCQAVYSKTLLKPDEQEHCKSCGADLIRREDDKEEVVRERLRVYAQHSGELLGYYRAVKQSVEELNVSGLDIKSVFERFKQVLVR
jgi:adenylate kinase